MKSSRGPSTPDLRCPSIEANMGETSGESWDKSRKPGLSEETCKQRCLDLAVGLPPGYKFSIASSLSDPWLVSHVTLVNVVFLSDILSSILA